MRPGVDELFHSLADLPPGEQAARLADIPRGLDTLREVRELLAHDDAAIDPLTPCIGAVASVALREMDPIGARCGPFRLVSLIGRGGMGVVYFAERVDGEVRQRAAVKLLHPGSTNMHRDRFLREREVLAALSHPNIARLLDAGHLRDGQPYLAMEYVEGRPIDLYCSGLPLRQKIGLFLKVCAAANYLHRNHLVHRDLKPGNILVDAEGEPKLLDFGISKALDAPSDVTATRFRMLTPDYASPEQVSGGPVGPASDIYSLGVMLRQLAAGDLRGDLDIVVRAATRPEPEARYESVERLAADLQAVLDSRPIHERKRDWIYRARKLAARRPAAVLLGAAIATIPLGLALRHGRPASPAALMAKRITANTSDLPVHSAAISPDGKWIGYSDPLGIHLRDTASGATRLLPRTAGHSIAHWMPDSAALLATVEKGESLESVTVTLSGLAEPAGVPSTPSPDGRYRAISPPGVQRIVVENTDRTSSHEVWKVAPNRTLNGFAWSPSSRELAVISSAGSVSTLELIDVATGRSSILIPDERKLSIGGIVWTAPARIVFSTFELVRSYSYNSNLWEVRLNARRELAAGSLRQLTAWSDFPIQGNSLTTDGSRLLFVRKFSQRDVYVAPVDPSRHRIDPPRRLTLDLGDDYPTAWTRDNQSVILTSDRAGDSRIYRQDVGHQEAEPLVASPGKQILPRMSPDGRSVLFCEIVANGSCRIMRAPLGGGKPQLVETIPSIGDFRCSPAGPCVVTEFLPGRKGRVVSELDPHRGKGREIYREFDVFAGTPDISPDGRTLAAVSKTKIALRSFTTGALLREIQVQDVNQIASLDYAPDGKGFYAGEIRATEVRQLYVDLGGRVSLLWRQPGKSLIWGVPSPNGRNLALLMYTTDANVYMVEGI